MKKYISSRFQSLEEICPEVSRVGRNSLGFSKDWKSAFLLISAILLPALTGMASATEIEPTWESLAKNYQVPDWFIDGKIGVWMHWGIPSAADEDRPNDGSHYARRMYATVPDNYSGELNMSQTLTKWHTQRYGHPSEFGYEDLIPLFKADKWDPQRPGEILQRQRCPLHHACGLSS
jgi:hypothetical protein